MQTLVSRASERDEHVNFTPDDELHESGMRPPPLVELRPQVDLERHAGGDKEHYAPMVKCSFEVLTLLASAGWHDPLETVTRHASRLGAYSPGLPRPREVPGRDVDAARSWCLGASTRCVGPGAWHPLNHSWVLLPVLQGR